MKIGPEPGLQLILIVSAMMHILVIALISNPFGVKEKVDDSYFVKLVMPAKINQPPKAALIKKALKKEKTVVNVKPKKKQIPVKKQAKVKSPEISIKPIEKKSIKKSYVAKKQSSKSMLPLAKSRSITGKKYSIKRKMQSSKEKYNSDTLAMDRTGRGSKFPAKADIAKQGKVIAGKGVSGKTEYKSVAKGLREQSFASIADKNTGQNMIERNNRVVERENVPVEKALRDSMFAAAGKREEIDESQYEISREEKALKNETLPEYPEDDTVEYPETDFSRNTEMASISENEAIPAISRPVASASSFVKKVSLNAEKELIKETAHDDEKRENNKTLSELSIQGVPLDDLNACENALDERMLKKKILNIVGDEKGCDSQDEGEFMFIGTSRFASFDMKILPRAGRKLSNRCEELKNAVHCLTLK